LVELMIFLPEKIGVLKNQPFNLTYPVGLHAVIRRQAYRIEPEFACIIARGPLGTRPYAGAERLTKATFLSDTGVRCKAVL